MEDEPFPIPVTSVFDLHSVPPRDVRDCVDAYLDEAHRLGLTAVRLIHGRGVGQQRETVRAVLAGKPYVAHFADAPPEAGGWGATIVTLQPTGSKEASQIRRFPLSMSDSADQALETVRPTKPDYGLDAPWLVRLLGGAGAGALLVGVLIRLPESLYVLQLPLVLLQWAGIMGLAQAGLMVLSSFYGKLRARDRLLASIPWRGDERVLDVACGRGLMLVAAAKRLTTGKAIGIDNWRSDDLSENWAEATWDNARLEGVEDRIEIRDGDYRELAFEDASFDVILASLAFYMLDNAGQRLAAMNELARVLKPGGCLVILDVGLLSAHARLLREAGLTVKWEGFRAFMYPPASVLRAVKN